MSLCITAEEYQDHCDSYDGLCLGCGEIKFGSVEPDAEDYPCEACGKNKVIGMENAMISGEVEICE